MNVPRRILCLFALVISFALAGCGGGSSATSSPGGAAKDQADKKAKTKGLEMPPKLD